MYGRWAPCVPSSLQEEEEAPLACELTSTSFAHFIRNYIEVEVLGGAGNIPPSKY